MAIEAIASSDFSGLSEIKTKNKDEALPLVAKQFEALFLQSMLKSMRSSQHFLEETSPFRNKDDTFEEMLDTQYASNIANGPRGIGLAKMLIQQLQPKMPLNPQSVENSLPSVKSEALKSNSLGNYSDEFIKSIWPMAKKAASAIGLDPKILLAQAALETGWGKFINKTQDGESSNNLFNIKAAHKDEPSVSVQTTEYIANTPIKMNAAFKKYASFEQSFQDYISLIQKSPRYQEALVQVQNPEKYIQSIHQAGYATDPHYSEKILAIYKSEELKESLVRCGIANTSI